MKKVLVLMGGNGSEREVSIKSAKSVVAALEKLNFDVILLDFDDNFIANIKGIKPDVVFNAMHGKYGEDGTVPAILDVMKIPYTHSGVFASSISMDKDITRRVCSTVGIHYPKYDILYKGEDELNINKINEIGKPFVIKPISEGSSIGVEIILKDQEFDIKNYAWNHGDKIIVEKYVKGRELQIAIFGNKALGVLEVQPKGLFYDYNAKYISGDTKYIMPAEISKEDYSEVMRLSEICHNIIECSEVSRVEFILDESAIGKDRFNFLEINTHPGFTETSIVPKIAKYNGISFESVVHHLVNTAKYKI